MNILWQCLHNDQHRVLMSSLWQLKKSVNLWNITQKRSDESVFFPVMEVGHSIRIIISLLYTRITEVPENFVCVPHRVIANPLIVATLITNLVIITFLIFCFTEMLPAVQKFCKLVEQHLSESLIKLKQTCLSVLYYVNLVAIVHHSETVLSLFYRRVTSSKGIPQVNQTASLWRNHKVETWGRPTNKGVWRSHQPEISCGRTYR